MEYTGITFGLEVLISVVFGAGGALGVWFKLKGSVNIQAVEISSLNSELKDIKDEYKEDKKSIHRRIDSLKVTVEKNREKQDHNQSELKSDMQKMELRIIQAIHEIKK